MHRALRPASDPVDRKCQFSLPALHCADASIQVGRDFLPGIETSEIALIAGIRHRRTAIMVILFKQRSKTIWDSVTAEVAYCLESSLVHGTSLFPRCLRPCHCLFRPGFSRFGLFFLLCYQFALTSDNLRERSIHDRRNAVSSVRGTRTLLFAVGRSAGVDDGFSASHGSASMRSSILSGRNTGIHGAFTHRTCTFLRIPSLPLSAEARAHTMPRNTPAAKQVGRVRREKIEPAPCSSK